MERKTWVMPMTLVQKFEANETVAAQCYEIACGSNVEYNLGEAITFKPIKYNGPAGMKWGAHDGYVSGNTGTVASLPPDFSHKGNCKVAQNNVFRIEGDDITFLAELQGGGQYTGNVDWYDKGSDGTLGTGDVVYWYTQDGNLRWNHWGYLTPISSNHPNRS